MASISLKHSDVINDQLKNLNIKKKIANQSISANLLEQILPFEANSVQMITE